MVRSVLRAVLREVVSRQACLGFVLLSSLLGFLLAAAYKIWCLLLSGLPKVDGIPATPQAE